MERMITTSMSKHKVRSRMKPKSSNQQLRNRGVVVSVPGTTANLGTGFDALGIALGLSNRCILRWLPDQKMIWKGASPVAKKMMKTAANLFFKRARCRKFGFSLQVDGDVPIARGLGSSVTVRLGLLAGLNKLAGSPLDRFDLLDLVTVLEGHPDNVAPAVLGGFVVSALEKSGKKWKVYSSRVSVDSGLKFILIIPGNEVETSKARKVLPKSYSRADVVHNLSRACLLTSALIQRRYDVLWTATDDRLHQPYRASLVHFLRPILEAAKRSGALGGWLSGSGSTICLVAKGKHAAIVKAVQKVVPKHSAWSYKVVWADNEGFRVQKL